ncbi:MAG TPA: hypothetical protein ENK84_08585 [Desulfobulbus sp.]|nr:hypothetical protein [Desulfobulbus sp.]
MFSQFFDHTLSVKQIDINQLRKRFDLAMTKKLAVIKLPPTFWMQDPKINPRVDHLLWAALLLDDMERASLAASALAVEHEEQQKKKSTQDQLELAGALDNSLDDFFQLIPGEENKTLRQHIHRLVERIKP